MAREIAIAAMTAKLRLPEDAPADKPKRKPTPDHILRVEVELTPGSAECAKCGGRLHRLGEDGGQWLDIVNQIVRPRFACSCCDCFTQAPLPSRSIERGRPLLGECRHSPVRQRDPGLLAHVLVNK